MVGGGMMGAGGAMGGHGAQQAGEQNQGPTTPPPPQIQTSQPAVQSGMSYGGAPLGGSVAYPNQMGYGANQYMQGVGAQYGFTPQMQYPLGGTGAGTGMGAGAMGGY